MITLCVDDMQKKETRHQFPELRRTHFTQVKPASGFFNSHRSLYLFSSTTLSTWTCFFVLSKRDYPCSFIFPKFSPTGMHGGSENIKTQISKTILPSSATGWVIGQILRYFRLASGFLHPQRKRHTLSFTRARLGLIIIILNELWQEQLWSEWGVVFIIGHIVLRLININSF